MAIKLQCNSFSSSSYSNPRVPQNSSRTTLSYRNVANLDHLLSSWHNSRKRWHLRFSLLETSSCVLNCRLNGFRKQYLTLQKSRKYHIVPLASADDGLTVNGSSQASTSSDVEEMREKLNQSLQGEDCSDGLVQTLHDAARVFELAIKEKSSSKISWFSTTWLGVDKNAWVKTLSYQASVYSLLQAAIEISSRGDRRDRDVNVFVQRSLSRNSASLENVIRDKLTTNQPEAYDWFWSKKIPDAVTSFVNYLEGDLRFSASTSVSAKGMPMGSGNASDISLLMLALTCLASVTKLGPAKVSCLQFFSTVPDITGRLMDKLVDFIPIRQAYPSIKNIGLRREFLVHFGPRVAPCGWKNDGDPEEVIFWVDLIQSQLQRAINRERIWSRLTTSESIEVLERDLAVFGFFIALGRSSQSFLSANGFDGLDDPLKGFIRYLVGGSVLYYPQLSSISSYQLYVEVVCEELDWLPFYPGDTSAPKQPPAHKSKYEGPPNGEALPKVLDVCSYWMQSFIKYSKWLENSSNGKAARFLSRGHNKLTDCMQELGVSNNEMAESDSKSFMKQAGSKRSVSPENVSDSFDKDLESIEEALMKLEQLLQQLHVSSYNSGKENLKAACTDLEKIRTLKKEAEFLEASFRAKAASLRQGDDESRLGSSIDGQRQYLKGKSRKRVNLGGSKRISGSRGFWSFFMYPPTWETPLKEDEYRKTPLNVDAADSESNEIHRFEHLRNELIELERRVQRSTNQSENEEDIKLPDGSSSNYGPASLVQVQKKESIIEKSIQKLKETSTDVWQGTQLLAIDVAAAMELLRRVLVGDELTGKEKKALRRTLTDLASVLPIGFLMLLPVTAVGHAAMLAAIQRYVPALIPSTYGSERLDLLRQLEKVKEMETCEMNPCENEESA